MRTAPLFTIIALLLLTACSQSPPKEVESRIISYFNAKMIAVYEFEAKPARPSQAFMELFRPKEAYCVTYKSGKHNLGSIAIVSKSGDVTIINPWIIADGLQSERIVAVGSKEDPSNENRDTNGPIAIMAKIVFEILWSDVCPYPKPEY